MRILVVAFLLVQALVVSRLVSGAAVDRRVNDRQRHTSVFKLLDTTRNQMRTEELEHTSTTVKNNQDAKEDEDEYYDGYESDDEMSGDYMHEPRVAMSVKPQDKSSVFEAENTELHRKRGKGKKKGKGLGRKRNPCLKKYKNYCIHGTCQYLSNIHSPSCVCHLDYSGDRCQFFTLPVQSPGDYNRTTALAVVAVVLSSICLTIIGLLLLLRFHKRGVYDVESEAKVKLGLTPNN
uniref:Proheparin-binding EGF-like growth factor n=1 Tax=Nothobranchius kadleci TaxID=1051664 RepID=A0A1A8C601_NOTKA